MVSSHDYDSEATAAMMSIDRRQFIPRSAKGRLTAILLVALIGCAVAVWLGYPARLPARFAAVVPGVLYRSGKVTPDQIERLRREFGIRQVISLEDESTRSQAERATAESLGMRWESVPLPRDGSTTPEDRKRLLALMRDSGAGPTLVHCTAGKNRVGLAIGMYRLHCQGWSFERAADEMRQLGFDESPRHGSLLTALRSEALAAQNASSRPARSP
jgi:protein tyrosine phosphatase (PTP) superfamily phosphohydrolase (DUF442 family)